jgi:hypothetical protein
MMVWEGVGCENGERGGASYDFYFEVGFLRREVKM